MLRDEQSFRNFLEKPLSGQTHIGVFLRFVHMRRLSAAALFI
ncbi:hypothetical protein QY95_04038 [Bacillus thermotolerans]|uniref:Uncharacterized protein n=1 Tax=Bacillus thermotolerans TaxID=1221996 RepID=A0A0F5HMU6_BACTR|nr:hypothetical protein QY95_04038 [Bacillus thermotolerans]